MLTQGFTVCLSSLELLNPGEQGIVTRFSNCDETIIQQLKEWGIKPGMKIVLEMRSHTFTIADGHRRWELDKAMARGICVRLTHTK